MPISMADQGRIVRITRISGNDKIRAHLHELGFVEKDEVIVISRTGKNLIVKVKDSRIAIDDTMARRIMVA